MDRPSRSMMLRAYGRQKNDSLQNDSEQKIEDFFSVKGRTAVLAIRCDKVSHEFIEAFCLEHGISCKIVDGYYHLS